MLEAAFMNKIPRSTPAVSGSKHRPGLVRRLFRTLPVVVLGSVILVVIVVESVPLPAALDLRLVPGVEFLDRNGLPLRTLLADGGRESRWSPLEEVSPNLVHATLAAEDRKFHSHRGVDFSAMARASRDALLGRKPRSGASTISQQLIKLTQPAPRSLRRKFYEMAAAVKLERQWTKSAILEAYLNRLDYGNLRVGIGSASRYYFRKPPSDLSPAEAAFLAGLPKAPSRLDPHKNFGGARERQLWILDAMRAEHWLDEAAHMRAVREKLDLSPREREYQAPLFVDLLLTRKGLLPGMGGPLRTTLDLELTRVAEETLADQLRLLHDRNVTSGAVVVIDNRTGDVLALAGPGDYFQPGTGQVNGAWRPRSPGSAVKPFTYLLALERGANPCTVVPDVPTDFSTPTGIYRPNNYNRRFHGPVSLRFALGNSLNVASLRTLELAGGPEALHRALRTSGITTLGHPASHYGPGLTLGNGEVRLLELTNAYATLARMGVFRPVRLVLRDSANLEPARHVFGEKAAHVLADMLSDNSARASAFGLHSHLAFDFPVACKTGTSSDYRDNWALGFTPEFTVGVWIGNMDGSPMREITGVTGAAPVLHTVMTRLHESHGTSWYAKPDGLIDAPIHPLTGRLTQEGQPGAQMESCLWPPEAARTGDFDADGRVVLPGLYAEWVAGPQNHLGSLVVCPGDSDAVRILHPAPNAVYYLDRDLPEDSRRIALRAVGGKVEWTSETMRCVRESGGAWAVMSLGRHTLTARDTVTGRTDRVEIEVLPW